VALLFHHAAHEYFLDGPPVPSNTEVLKAQGLVRFDGVPTFILERARLRGSAVHQLAHYANENDLDEASIDPAYAGYLAGWRRCCAERRIVPRLCEYRVASRRHRVAGTLDLLCDIDGEGWLLDYCTGDLAKLAKHLQTGGYLGMAFEWAKDDPRLAEVLGRHQRWRRAGVRLRRDGTFKFIEYEDPTDYSRFLTLAAAWHIRQAEGASLLPEDLAA
jgi:hypothetical protein